MQPVNRQGTIYMMAVLVAGLLACAFVGLVVSPMPPPAATETPTLTVVVSPAVTVTKTPQFITPTMTSTPQIVATVEDSTPNIRTLTPNVPVSVTPAQEPKSSRTPVTVDNCRHGVITAHAAIDQVLATKPERRCEGCVYYASVLCQDIGMEADLHIWISKIQVSIPAVRIVDCATWAVGQWPQKAGRDWLGELDINSWPAGAPMAPLEAELCPALPIKSDGRLRRLVVPFTTTTTLEQAPGATLVVDSQIP